MPERQGFEARGCPARWRLSRRRHCLLLWHSGKARGPAPLAEALAEPPVALPVPRFLAVFTQVACVHVFPTDFGVTPAAFPGNQGAVPRAWL